MYLPLRNLQSKGVARYHAYKVKLESVINKEMLHEKDIQSSHLLKTETSRTSDALAASANFLLHVLHVGHSSSSGLQPHIID